MASFLWLVTSKRGTGKLAVGMSVEIVINNSSRKPNQKEIIDAFNQKYGAGTVGNGTPVSNFSIDKIS